MFCDIGPTCYKIALQKEICKRHIKNFFVQESYADTQDTAPLPCIVAQYSSHLIKRGKGIDPVLQLSLIHIPSPRDVEESRMPSSA